MKSLNKSELMIAILLPFAVGSMSALFSGNMMEYAQIRRPGLTPPAAVFPIVWNILYLLMGISSYLIYESDNLGKTRALHIYALQLVFNFFWSIIFSTFSMYIFALIWLIIMIVLIVMMIRSYYSIRPIAAYLQIPYLLWCIFAAYLNFMIIMLN